MFNPHFSTSLQPPAKIQGVPPNWDFSRNPNCPSSRTFSKYSRPHKPTTRATAETNQLREVFLKVLRDPACVFCPLFYQYGAMHSLIIICKTNLVLLLLLFSVRLFATPQTVDYQTPLSMEFSRQEYWSRLSFLSPGHLPDPGIEPLSLVSPTLAVRSFTTSSIWTTNQKKKRENQAGQVPSVPER